MPRLLPILLAVIVSPLWAAPTVDNGRARARELQSFIQKEKSAYQARQSEKQGLIAEVDQLNAEQNGIRQHIEKVSQHQQELSMALENLSLEYGRQKEMAAFEKRRLWLLYKVVYKLKKDGILRFLFPGSGAKEGVTGRTRVLFRTLRSRVHLTKQLEERLKRLQASEARLEESKQKNQALIDELQEQQGMLTDLQNKKRQMLSVVNRKQDAYQAALKEYRQVSKQVAALFDNFESIRDTSISALFPRRGSLPLPVDLGHVVKNFGKSVNERFGTVVYQKGVEIQAEMSAPVRAVMAGTIEFEGWVKGLGNVVIIHHGGGFYSLSGHLYRSLKTQGNQVEQGEIVGLVGDTGNSELPSLYFELRENSKAVDPIAYFASTELKKLN